MTRLAAAIATLFWLGRIPPAPGTLGSAAAVALAWGLHRFVGAPALVLATVAAFVLGWWATARHQAATGRHDPGEVIIDEVVGQWLALWPLSLGLWWQGVDPAVFPWPGWVFGFLFFRLFDIVKPGPVGRADRMDSALGVMLDDVLAGLFAAICVMLLAGLFHGLLR